MTDFEKLVNSITKSMEKDGTPVTREEAEEMAKMELGAAQIHRYEKSATPRKKSAPRERKVDPDKKYLLHCIMQSIPQEIQSIKNEAEFSFTYNANSYTVKLIKHRPKK